MKVEIALHLLFFYGHAAANWRRPVMLLILMYHALWPALPPERLAGYFAADPQLREPGARKYALAQPDFAAQLEVLRAAGFACVTDLSEFPAALAAENRVLITFDDGHASNYELARPALLDRGQCGLFFITTDWIGQPGFMTAEQLRAMRRNGMMIGAHGASHRYFGDLSELELADELRRSRVALENILQEPVHSMALPGGRGHGRLDALAREAGFDLIFTSRNAVATPGDPLNRLPRIPVTNDLNVEFIARIVRGDFSELERMRRGAQRRDLAKRMMGNRLYDWVRGLMLRK